MRYTTSRAAALGEAMRKTLERPVEFALVVASTGALFALAVSVALVIWRAVPVELPPPWMRPQALVLAAGAQGEIDLSLVQSALRRISPVASADFLSRDAALTELAQRKSLATVGLTDLRPNPLPDAFLVRFAPRASPEAVEAAVAELRKVKNVESVEFQPELYRKMSLLAQLAGRLGLVLVVALAASLILGVALTATFWGRVDQDEVDVLHMLGAENSVIRRPYVYAGAVSLLLAGAVAWSLVAAAGAWLDPLITAAAQQYALPLAPSPLPIWSGFFFCLGAALVGALLASLAARMTVRR